MAVSRDRAVAPASGALLAIARRISERLDIWEGARADAELAYEDWCRMRGAEAYFLYRAAQDRADAAQDTLALWAVKHPRDRSWLCSR